MSQTMYSPLSSTTPLSSTRSFCFVHLLIVIFLKDWFVFITLYWVTGS